MFHHHRHDSPRQQTQEVAPLTAYEQGGQTPVEEEPEVYPEALSSGLEDQFTGPILGTAIIGRHMPYNYDDDDVFELVAPDGTVLNRNHAAARHMLRNIEASLTQIASTPSLQQSGSGSTAASGQTAASPAPEEEPTGPVLPNQGGFVVFSDLYLEAHPNSRITSVSDDYTRASAGDTQLAPLEIEPTAHSERQRLLKMKYMLKEVNVYHRPMFRRRPSNTVYGSASYLPTESTDAALTAELSNDSFADMLRGVDALPSTGSNDTVDTNTMPPVHSDTLDTFGFPQMPTRKGSTITVADSISAGQVY